MPDDLASRLAAAGSAVGANRPQLASTLASSDLSHGEIQAVGGFAKALSLAATNRLAADSGAKTNFTDDEKSSLDGINEPLAGVEAESSAKDSRSSIEKATDWIAGALSNTGSFLVHNPVSDKIFDVFDFLGNAAHMPFRLMSDGLDSSNNDEIDASMKAQGYDPESTTSYLAFMFNQGEAQYHDLNDVRDTYGDDLVDLAMRQQADPEQFQADFEKMDPAAAAELQQKLQSEDFQKAFEAVDRQHISPGRDIARIVTAGHTDNAAFTLLSGTLDAAYTWFTDPTLVVGKGIKAAREIDVATGALAKGSAFSPTNITARTIDSFRGGKQRAGLASIADQAGIEKALATEGGKAVTQVGKGWESFLDQAKQLREQHALSRDTSLSADARAQAEAKRAAIYHGMTTRFGSLMPLLDEVNGLRVVDETAKTGGKIDALSKGHIVSNGQPIETLDQLAKHLISTDGLLRLHGGEAARQSIVMPGRLTWRAEQRAKRAGNRAEKWIDYTKRWEVVPDDAEAGLLGDAARLGDAQYMATLKSARAKAERVGRRLTTLLPKVDKIDLTDANSGQIVEQFARLYLNKGDAARLASAYSLGDIAARRQVVRGMLEQSFHASGLAKSPAGREFMERYIGDQTQLAKQKYGHGDTSQILRNGTKVDAALYPDQISTSVVIPSFREMNYLATKFAVHGFAGRTGLAHVRAGAQGPGMDALMGVIKMGWITSAAGGLRNALDEIANFAAYGMGRQVLQGRAVFTQATKDLRAERRELSKQYLKMVKLQGREAADESVGRQVGGAVKSHQDAKLALEQAKRADAARENLPNALAKRVTNAEARVAEVKQLNYRALQEFEDAKAAGLPEEELAPFRDKAQRWSDERVTAESALKEHRKNAANPDKMRAKIEESFAKREVPSVADAERDLKAAEAELRRARGLESAIRHRVPLLFRQAADNVNDVLTGVVLGKALSVFGENWKVTPERVRYAQELTDAELTRVLQDGVFQSHFADNALVEASDDGAMALHRAGLRARQYAYGAKSEGWGKVEVDGGAGLDAWAKTLHLRFNDESSPAHAWVQTYRSYLPENATIEQRKEALIAARRSVRERLDEEDLRHFVQNAEVFKQTKAGIKVGDDPELLKVAKEEYADRITEDLVAALAPRNGKGISRKLLDKLADSHATGEVPDRSWLAQLDQAERPESTIGQLWAPYNPRHEPGSMPSGYTQMLSKAYDKVVTDQINALSRNPLMTALYMNARENTLGYERKLIEAGWDEHSAREVTKRIALQHAQDEAFKHIDNPYVASQFTTISRNYFAFVRAQEDWLRRWGRTIKDNPEIIRKGQLLIHGGTSTGMVEKDDQGNLNFVYPGSGLMLGAFNKLFGIFQQDSPVQVPVTGELSSQLTFLNPSLDNPLGFSGTPLLSIPFKAITSLLGPDHALVTSSMDKVINGDMGAGKEWYETMLPSWANRILSGVVSDDPASKFGAAVTQALANMEAAGLLDDPELQTPTGKARLQNALSVTMRNNLAATTLFAFALPAAPTLNPEAGGTAEGYQGNKPDFSAHIEGLRTLKDEARKVFSKLPYDQALAWWTAVHPHELIYAQTGSSARTQVGTKSASAPATIAAATWLEENQDFATAKGYGGKGGVAAYFIPQGKAGTTNGSYSDVAYRAQLEMGIREHKSLDEYFDDIVTSRGMAQYFAAKDEYDKRRASVQGSKTAVDALDAEWAAKKAEIYASNPLLAQKFAESATGNANVGGQLAQLVKMVTDTSPSTNKALGANRSGVVALLTAYQEYKTVAADLGDRRGNVANRRRQQAKDAYEANVQAITEQYPGLADLARGVFRLP